MAGRESAHQGWLIEQWAAQRKKEEAQAKRRVTLAMNREKNRERARQRKRQRAIESVSFETGWSIEDSESWLQLKSEQLQLARDAANLAVVIALSGGDSNSTKSVQAIIERRRYDIAALEQKLAHILNKPTPRQQEMANIMKGFRF